VRHDRAGFGIELDHHLDGVLGIVLVIFFAQAHHREAMRAVERDGSQIRAAYLQ
jgi:hypothetical protein